MTLITRLSGTPDPTLPRLVPALGMSIDHFWHPRSFTPGSAVWTDEINGLALNVYLGTGGALTDITVDTVASTGRPIVHTKSTANVGGGPGAAELGTFLFIGKPTTGDVQASGTTYALFGGQSGIWQDTGLDTVTTNPTTSTMNAHRDQWHMYAISNPTSKLFEFAVDGSSTILATAVGAQNANIAIGGKADTSVGKREFRIAAVIASRTVYTGAQLTGTVFPAAKAWFTDLF